MTINRIEIFCNSPRHRQRQRVVAFYRRGGEHPKAAEFRREFGGVVPPMEGTPEFDQWIEEYPHSNLRRSSTWRRALARGAAEVPGEDLTQVILWGSATENPLNAPAAQPPRAVYPNRCSRCGAKAPLTREKLLPILDRLADEGKVAVSLSDL